VCTASVHNTKQNSSDNLPSYLQTNIIAQMLSIRGERDKVPEGAILIFGCQGIENEVAFQRAEMRIVR